jgi:polysaccharide export outer membrane protein
MLEVARVDMAHGAAWPLSEPLMIRTFFLVSLLFLAACSTSGRMTSPPGTVSVLGIDPFVEGGMGETGDYRIGPGDELNVSVFQVEDLSFEKVRVDASGLLQLPLIGSVQAAGRTPNALSQDIALKLSERYLRNPQVTITVSEAASQKVTVDGAVTKPGVYVMRGRTTLLQAVAMAEGPTRVADLKKVAVFRTVEGRRMVALYDLQRIRNGSLQDPFMSGDDVIIVDTSRLSARFQDIIQILPGLAVFAYL